MFRVNALHKKLEGTIVLEVEIARETAENLIEYALNDLLEKGAAHIEEAEEKNAYKLYIAEPEGNS